MKKLYYLLFVALISHSCTTQRLIKQYKPDYYLKINNKQYMFWKFKNDSIGEFINVFNCKRLPDSLKITSISFKYKKYTKSDSTNKEINHKGFKILEIYAPKFNLISNNNKLSDIIYKVCEIKKLDFNKQTYIPKMSCVLGIHPARKTLYYINKKDKHFNFVPKPPRSIIIPQIQQGDTFSTFSISDKLHNYPEYIIQIMKNIHVVLIYSRYTK